MSFYPYFQDLVDDQYQKNNEKRFFQNKEQNLMWIKFKAN